MTTTPDTPDSSLPKQVDGEAHKPTKARKPRIGSVQGRILGLLLTAFGFGKDRLSVIDLISAEDTESERRRYVRLQYKKAIAALVRKSLVEQAGTTISHTGQATGHISDFLGKRVPKGYSRTVATFTLTEAGRIKSLEIQQTLTHEELSLLIETIRQLKE